MSMDKDICDNKRKIGRPRKKDYNEEEQFRQLLESVDYVFDCTGEIKATAIELEMSSIKVKKLLITSGRLEYDETKQIHRLMSYGKKIAEIQKELGLKKSSINSYLPYTKIPYKENEISANAERCDLYRRRKQAIENIVDRESLWQCIELFQDYTFCTKDGIKFSYKICEDELLIRHNGSIGTDCERVPRIKIEQAYQKAMYQDIINVNQGQNAYICSIFFRIGLVI